MDGTRKDNRTNKPFAEMKHLVVSQHIVLLSFPIPSISLFVLSLKNLPTSPNFYPVELDNIVAQLHIYVFTSVPETCLFRRAIGIADFEWHSSMQYIKQSAGESKVKARTQVQSLPYCLKSFPLLCIWARNSPHLEQLPSWKHPA